MKSNKEKSKPTKNSADGTSFKETYFIVNNNFKILNGGDDLAKNLAIETENGDCKEFFLLFSNSNTKKLKSLISEVIKSTGYQNTESKIRINNQSFICSIDIIPNGNTALLLVKNITKKKNTLSNLKTSQKKLRHLTKHLHNVREKERSNLAREVHDDLGQKLTALQIELGLLLNEIKINNYKLSARQIYKSLKSVNALLTETIDSKKQLINSFRLDFLEEFGLIESIRHYLEEFQARYSIEYYFYSDWDHLELEYNKSVALYRILQEALTNVAKHSLAKKVDVSLVEINNRIFLTIEDDGIGFDTNNNSSTSGVGIIGMEERILIEGGKFSIKGKNGKGTKIETSVKLE